MNRSRKLNAQLEKAIQQAMTELDRIPTTTATKTTTATSSAITSDVSQAKTSDISASPLPVKSIRTRVTRASAAQQRTKLIKIAPAPPNNGQKSFHV